MYQSLGYRLLGGVQGWRAGRPSGSPGGQHAEETTGAGGGDAQRRGAGRAQSGQHAGVGGEWGVVAGEGQTVGAEMGQSVGEDVGAEQAVDVEAGRTVDAEGQDADAKGEWG